MVYRQCHRRARRAHGDFGQVLPLVAVAVVVAAGAVVLATYLGVVVIDRHRAQTAADAAALAGVISGQEAADALSIANGGVLEHFRLTVDARGEPVAEVRVRMGRASAVASAGLAGVPVAAPPGTGP